MAETPDQRRLKRRHLFYYLKVFDAASGRLIGHLVDLTREGVMILTADPVEVGAPFRLRLELPQEVDGQNDLLIEARSAWCRRDTNPDYWGVGFRLERVTRGSRSLVESMIYKFGFTH